MSDKEINDLIEIIKEKTKDICKDKETAKQYLVDLGINKEDGSLTAEYKPA